MMQPIYATMIFLVKLVCAPGIEADGTYNYLFERQATHQASVQIAFSSRSEIPIPVGKVVGAAFYRGWLECQSVMQYDELDTGTGTILIIPKQALICNANRIEIDGKTFTAPTESKKDRGGAYE